MDGERERGERGEGYGKKAWGSGGGKGERGREKQEVESVERNRAELLSDAINVCERETEREIQAFVLILFVENQTASHCC